jgi:DNA-binding MarR family transcriptional regulator
MGDLLKKRLQQQKFSSPYQEALLNILVCADHLTRRMEAVCAQHGITAAQYNVLRILRGVYPNGHARCDIINRMLQTAPDVTRLIDRLIRAGLARRGRSEIDARLSLTFITEQGLELLAVMDPDILAGELSLAQLVSERDARQVSKLCERIYGGLE